MEKQRRSWLKAASNITQDDFTGGCGLIISKSCIEATSHRWVYFHCFFISKPVGNPLTLCSRTSVCRIYANNPRIFFPEFCEEKLGCVQYSNQGWYRSASKQMIPSRVKEWSANHVLSRFTALLFIQPFRHFTYVTTHSPTLPSLYPRHSSFSNPSVASPTSQFILQPLFRFSYVTSSSLNSPGEHNMDFPYPENFSLVAYASFLLGSSVRELPSGNGDV